MIVCMCGRDGINVCMCGGDEINDCVHVWWG